MKTPFNTPFTLPLSLVMAMLTRMLPAQTYINTEWVQSTGAPDNIPWTASVIDVEENLIVVGNTQVAPGNADVLVTKYDKHGEFLWQQTYAGTAGTNDYGIAVTVNIASDIFVAATVTNTGSQQDFAVLKYNAQGALQWDATWDGPAGLADVPAGMAVDNAGSLYVCGAPPGPAPSSRTTPW